jgi:hypothetical protein
MCILEHCGFVPQSACAATPPRQQASGTNCFRAVSRILQDAEMRSRPGAKPFTASGARASAAQQAACKARGDHTRRDKCDETV